MSGEVHHCPYCSVGGQYRPMKPLGQSKEYRCSVCGHTIVENNPSHLCACSHCKATREESNATSPHDRPARLSVPDTLTRTL